MSQKSSKKSKTTWTFFPDTYKLSLVKHLYSIYKHSFLLDRYARIDANQGYCYAEGIPLQNQPFAIDSTLNEAILKMSQRKSGKETEMKNKTNWIQLERENCRTLAYKTIKNNYKNISELRLCLFFSSLFFLFDINTVKSRITGKFTV